MGTWGWTNGIPIMAEIITLHSLFESQKLNFKKEIGGLRIPQDLESIQNKITEYLNSLFDSNGNFRQNLTQGEDYILKSAINLLMAQQDICSVLTESVAKSTCDTNHPNPTSHKVEGSNGINISPKSAVIASGSGALAGKVIFGGWGAVFGAIAGTAVSIYLASRPTSKDQGPASDAALLQIKSFGQLIDANKLCSIIENICNSVDDLISTFRAQINRVVGKYEEQEKPSLEKDYKFLLESIQTLVGYSRTHGEEEKFNSKIRVRINDLAESLENYNIQVVDYDNEINAQWFEQVESDNAKEIKMVYPALVRDDQVILQGKVFVPSNL